MARKELHVLVRLKHDKHFRIQCMVTVTVFELLTAIATALHVSVDQLTYASIYRTSTTTGRTKLGGGGSFGGYYDASVTLEKYGVLPNEELLVDLTDVPVYQDSETTGTEPSYVNHQQQALFSSSASSSLSSSSILYSSHISPSHHPTFDGHSSSKSKVTSKLNNKSTGVPSSSKTATTSSSISKSSTSSKITVNSNNKSSSSSSIHPVGQLVRWPVPPDNSCLFSSFNFVFNSGKIDMADNKYLRNIIATKIESDQKTYSEALLGRANSDYCKWIRKDDSWGGGIELAILTQLYEIEICVINTECGGRIDYFGEDRHFPYRVFLLYNNLHYDPVYHTKMDMVEEKELIQTKFHRTDEAILTLAKDLIDELISDAPSISNALDQETPVEFGSTEQQQPQSQLMHVTL